MQRILALGAVMSAVIVLTVGFTAPALSLDPTELSASPDEVFASPNPTATVTFTLDASDQVTHCNVTITTNPVDEVFCTISDASNVDLASGTNSAGPFAVSSTVSVPLSPATTPATSMANVKVIQLG